MSSFSPQFVDLKFSSDTQLVGSALLGKAGGFNLLFMLGQRSKTLLLRCGTSGNATFWKL